MRGFAKRKLHLFLVTETLRACASEGAENFTTAGWLPFTKAVPDVRTLCFECRKELPY